jgi:hypothetical protein
MNKKLIILISVLVLLLATGGGYLIVSLKNKTNISPTPSSESATAKEVASPDLDYSDASGFSFSYPKSLRVEDVTPSDDSYYSKLTLTKSGGKLTITVKDETEKTIDGFLSSDDYYKNAAISGATTLAGIPAKEYGLDGKKITVALKDGILYLVEGNKDGDFWEGAQGIVVSTFSFGQKSSESSSDANTTYEPEEVVE